MNTPYNIEQRVLRAHLTTQSALDERILREAKAMLLSRSTRLPSDPLWRRIMTNRWTKRTAIAASLAAVAVFAVMVTASSQKAYAISETQKATEAIKSVHVRIEPAGAGIGEAWAIFTEHHQLLKLRMDFPDTEDGPKVTIWEKDNAVIWFKKKNAITTVSEKAILSRLPGFFNLVDPKPLVDSLMQTQGKAPDTKIQLPTEKETRIVITASSPQKEEVFFINAKTRLPEQIIVYSLKEGGRQLLTRKHYSDYDAVDPNVFSPEFPQNAIRVDSTARDLGLEKGDLTDRQIAQKLLREFLDALVAKDYAKAGKLGGGIAAENAKDLWGQTEYVRVVRIGEPSPDPDRRTLFVHVPCEVEVKTDGTTEVRALSFRMRPIYGQMGRWAIGGEDKPKSAEDFGSAASRPANLPAAPGGATKEAAPASGTGQTPRP